MCFINIRKAEPGDTIVKELRDILYEAEIGDEFEFIVEAQKGENSTYCKENKKTITKKSNFIYIYKFFKY